MSIPPPGRILTRSGARLGRISTRTRADVRANLDTLRADVRASIDTLRADVRADIAALGTRLIEWMIGIALTATGIVVAAGTAFAVAFLRSLE